MLYKKTLLSGVRFVTLLLAAAMFCLSVSAKESDGYSWYCKRAADHAQPVLPPEFSFINGKDGYWIGSADEKVVYLTFDAGYENGNIEKILNILNEKKVPAAFFVLINLLKKNPALIKRMEEEGHLVCNHTAHHKDMTKIVDKMQFYSELHALEAAYKELTGKDMQKFYRPPEGRFNERNLEIASEYGYKTVFWSFAYADWDNAKQPSADAAKKKILDNVHNGAVLLLHPTSSTNAEILGDVIDSLISEGYRFGTLEELVER
jgi:peptidoglycan-N-acetylmuramic acid deacetylase